MKIIECRTTADNIISNRTIDQMQKYLFHLIPEWHLIGGIFLDGDHIGPAYPYQQDRRFRGL